MRVIRRRPGITSEGLVLREEQDTARARVAPADNRPKESDGVSANGKRRKITEGKQGWAGKRAAEPPSDERSGMLDRRRNRVSGPETRAGQVQVPELAVDGRHSKGQSLDRRPGDGEAAR